MFYCPSCGKTFEYPKVVKEYRGEFWGMPAYEDMYYCPECGDDDYDEIKCMDAYGNPIYLHDYYYEVQYVGQELIELYSEDAFEENLSEILGDKCLVERKYVV